MRILSALVFTPALVLVLWVGGLALQLACCALSLLILLEYTALVLQPGRIILRGACLCGGAAVAIDIAFGLPVFLSQVLPAALVVAMLVAVLCQPEPLPSSVQQAALAMLGIAWCAGLLPHLARLRAQPHDGPALALLVLLATWSADTGAYFAGRLFGRHRLYPAISPAKTIEGALGGLLCACLAGAVVRAVLPWQPGLAATLVLAAACAVGGTLGDLSESMLKRSVGAKDSSRLIPGHGGVFDRFDGVLFAVGLVAALWPYVSTGK